MKALRFVAAASLALAMLIGTLLALAQWQPSTARAKDAVNTPLAPQTLPPPWLSDDDVADAPSSFPNIWPPAAVDGLIAPGEYAHAGKVTFPGHGGDVEVFFREDGNNLYIAFDFPDSQTAGSAAQVLLDTNHDGGTAPQTDDYLLSITQWGTLMERPGTGTGWGGAPPVSWTAATTVTLSGWQAEFCIQYDKLGLTAGTFQVMGLGLINAWTPSWDHYWPNGAFWLNPNSWGDLVSSSDWGTFYWKPGPWEDYAPSGMPDFDQNQIVTPTYCGPFAAANSLWWFDSKFETPDHPPPAVSDTYRLVRSYGPWDDHDISNTVPLAKNLAWYFDTDGIRTGGTWQGTYVTDMHSGTLAYLRDHGLWDDYHVTLVISPSFQWVADEVMRSEDVILLLGFYEWVEPPGYWVRVGGHYVTVAGVDPMGGIAFSDPFVDAAEMGLAPGRILSGTLIPHQPIPGHASNVHNDAGNVSHDIYPAIPTDSPGGTWGPDWYPLAFEPGAFANVNPHPFIPTEPWGGTTPLQVEVEFALTVSPYTWKASGEWLPEENPVRGTWQPWQDYAPNGVPDFDQKQDSWGHDWGMGWKWSFCGPVAAANSLWWFDSKFEPDPITPTVPGLNDNYPLVQSYDPAGIWDDHDPLNVDDPNTPWPGPGILLPPVPPGQGEFVEDLAAWFQTDMIGIGGGTVITNLYTGIEQYIAYKNLRQGYVITQVKSPDFWWVAEEVEVSEDVILLLGFWQEQPAGSENWVRLGGHYVTLPGVDKQGGFVAFSDPWFDRIEQTWPYAGIGSLAGWPSYMGRVANGWLQPHQHPPVPPDTTHNDAGNVSHDIYNVIGTNSPGGVWGPEDYVDAWGFDIENFWGQNGQEDLPTPTGDPIQTEVEWAVAVSPVADVWITKTVTPTTLTPGDWVTFTITFANLGNDAENVVIYDALHPGLTNASYTYTLNYPGALASAGTYTWTVGTLRWQEGGTITVTAQVDPGLSWPFTTLITNTAEITTTTQEQYQIAQAANVARATLTVNAGGYLAGSVYDYETGSVDPPCTAAMVSIEPGGLTATVSSATGSYGPMALIAGTYTATASASGYSTAAYTVGVVVGMTTTRNFELQRPVVGVTPTDFISITALANQEVTHSLVITNAGHAAMDFEIQELPSDLTWVGVDPISGTIPGPGMTDVDVTFLCTETKDYTGTLHVIHGDPCETTPITVPIVLHCEQPCVEVTDVGLALLTGGTIYTDTNVQFSADITPDDAAKPYTYTIDYGDGDSVTAISSADPLTAPLDHVFDATGAFTVEIGVWNCAMTETQAVTSSVVVAVSEQPISCVEVTDVALTLLTSSPIYTLTNVQFSADVTPDNADKPYTYTIDYGDGDSVTAISSADPLTAPLDHVFDATGAFTVEIAVWNCAMTETQAVTSSVVVTVSALPPCDEVTDVSLTLVTAVTIYTDTVVEFDAHVRPPKATKPYSYTIDYGDGFSKTASSSEMHLRAPLDHIFAATGTFTVEIAVWNCYMTAAQAVTGSVEVTVIEHAACVEVTDVALALLTGSPIYTNTNVQFSADITPNDASTPYTYTIDYDDGTIVTATSIDDPLALNHTFATTGVHTVEIGVWNCAMTQAQAVTSSVAVTVSAQILPCVGITGVDFGSLPADPQAGEVVTFTITSILPINATPPFTYQWGFGDGGAATGNPVTHTYAISDSYWATVTATNPCGGPVWMGHPVNVTGESAITVAPLSLNVTLNPGETTVATLTIGNASTATANLNWELAENPARSWLDELPTNGTVTPSGSDDVAVTFDATFQSPGVYATTIEVTSDDPDKPQIDVSVVMTVNCIPVTGVDLVVLNAGTIYTDTVVEFNANIAPDNATKPYSYTIDYGDGVSTTAVSSADPLTSPLDHTFTATGTFTVEIAVWNCSMSAAQATTDSVQVAVSEQPTSCVEVSNVALTSLTSSPIYTTTNVQFSADIMPNDAGKPYNYTIDYGDGDSVTTTSSADPLALNHTFATTGTFTVEIGAWNCDMTEAQAITDTVEVTVSERPTSCIGVDITDVLSDSPVDLGSEMHFTATVIGDPPISYTWDFDSDGTPEQNGSGLNVVSHVYSAAGAYTVTLTVMNNCPSSDTHSFSVTVNPPTCEEIADVTLSLLTTGTIYTDTNVQFSADVAPDDISKPYTYRLTIDGAPGGVMTSSDDPLAFTETFASTGTHTIEIAAWNCGMTEAQAVTDAITFTVYEPGVCVPLTNITIHGETSGAPGVYTFTTSYEPTDASMPVTYLWNDGETTATSVRNLAEGTHELTVVAINCTTTMVTDRHIIVISRYIYLPLVMRGHS